jgi:hypothetical protein
MSDKLPDREPNARYSQVACLVCKDGEEVEYNGMLCLVDHTMQGVQVRVLGSIKDELHHPDNFKPNAF